MTRIFPTAVLPRLASIRLSILLLALSGNSVWANGVLRNGSSAESMALGGTNTASVHGVIDAMTGNPAGLSRLPDSSLQIGIGTALLDAKFSNAANDNVEANDSLNAIPDIAYAHKLGDVTIGLGLNPVALAESDWDYVDARGGSTGNVSYGRTTHRSRIIALRASIGAAKEIYDGVHFGATLGILYNENNLEAPYIFQSHPLLAGYKTLLDLETDGLGVNASFGLLFEMRDDWTVGLRYTTPTHFNTDGRASGNMVGEFGTSIPFSYDAEVDTALPAVASIGVEWQAQPHLRLHGQVDWIGWSRAFDDLPVRLSNGSNAAVNSLLGSPGLNDTAPLDWDNSWVFRIGAEYALSDHTDLRFGYSYGESPVPSTTLTPLTAAILEHTLGLGIGHRIGDYQIDLAYQWDLPATQRVDRSGLLSGEYNNSTVDVSIHWLTLNIAFASPFGG